MSRFREYIKGNKTISSLLNALLNAFVLWCVFSSSILVTNLLGIKDDNITILLNSDAFMVYIAVFGLSIVSLAIYFKYKRKPPYFSFDNDRFAYFTITARFATNYKKANLGTWNSKEKIENMEFLFGKIIPDRIICDNDNEQQKESNEELIELFTKEMNNNNKNDSPEQFYAYAPFILAEHYFYFNILNKLNSHTDPYQKTKDDSLINDDGMAAALLEFYNRKKQNKKDKLKQCISYCVNSNSTDLSQIVGHSSYISEQEQNYVNNDLKKTTDAIYTKKFDKIEILTDNYGLELISDIIFTLVLLDFDLTKKVVFHTRILPAFVSDVIVSEYGNDFEKIMEFLKQNNSEVAEKFYEYQNNNKIEIKSNLYWNMPFCYSKTKKYFKEIIPDDNKTLIVVKGDLNFRRLLDDRDWLNKKSFKNRVKNLNASIVALRSIKSSLLVDIKDKTKVDAIRNSITGIDGKFGSIHYYENISWSDKVRNYLKFQKNANRK